MFTIDPNAVYLKSELAEIAHRSVQTINNWCKSGLKHNERYITGKAVLEFMEKQEEKN